jgi:hypothetical protein
MVVVLVTWTSDYVNFTIAFKLAANAGSPKTVNQKFIIDIAWRCSCSALDTNSLQREDDTNLKNVNLKLIANIACRCRHPNFVTGGARRRRGG